MSGHKQDYYELLGVPRDATSEALKRAYRTLAVKFHPDKNPDDPAAEERFKAVSEAYAVLSDPDRRTLYDRYGHDGMSSMGGGVQLDPSNLQSVFGDLFEELFGGWFRKSATQHGRDIQIEVELTLEEVSRGLDKELSVRRRTTCGQCQGSGAGAGSRPEPCETCLGTGQVRVSTGFLALARACPACAGSGTTVRDPCRGCQGTGLIVEVVKLAVPIPPGIGEGVKIRVDGEGEPGRGGGMNGDLYVKIVVQTHDFFERRDNDVLCEVPISFPQAALGAQVNVPTLEGTVRVKVPSGTQSGRVLRLRGKGLHSLGGGRRGDQLVRLQVETPTRLTARQKELLEELEAISGGGAKGAGGLPKRKSFLDKLRAFLD